MPGQWRLSRIGSVAATVLLLANCAVGPDFQQPAAPDVTGYAPQPLAEQTSSADVKGGEAQRLVQDLDIPGQWWTLFHSAALNALVEQALKNNWIWAIEGANPRRSQRRRCQPDPGLPTAISCRLDTQN